MQKLSYSALQTFATCPLQYKYCYLDRLPSDQSAMMHFVGTLLHQVMQELHTSTLLPLSKDELAHLFSSKWQTSWYQGNQVLANHDFSDALSIIDREWQKKNMSPVIHTIALEKSFIFPVGNDFSIKGRIDRVDKKNETTLEIVDYKTGRSVPSQADVENNLQLAVYYLAAHTLWPTMEHTTLTLHYLRPDMVMSFTPDVSYKAQAEARLQDIIAEVASSDFAPQPGNYCASCSYRRICPMMKHKYAMAEVATTGKELADTYLQLIESKREIDGKVALAKKSVENFLDDAGFEQIFGEVGQVRRSTSQYARLNSTKVKAYLTQQGNIADFIESSTVKRLTVKHTLPPLEEIV